MLRHSLNQNFLGIFLAFLYAIATGISYLTVSGFEHHFKAIEFIFYNFVFATTIFTVVCVVKQSNTLELLWRNKGLVFLTNIATASGWLTAFLSLKYIDPTIVLAVMFYLQPISTIIIVGFGQGIKNIKIRDLIFALLITALLAVLVIYYIYKLKIAAHVNTLSGEYIFALILAIVSGLGSAYNVICTKRLSVAKFSVSQILSLRFYLIIFLAVAINVYEKSTFFLTFTNVWTIVFISIVSVIIPLFLLQKGVEFTTPINISFVTPFVPILTYFIGLIALRLPFSTIEFILIALLSITVCISVFVKSRSVLHVGPDKEK